MDRAAAFGVGGPSHIDSYHNIARLFVFRAAGLVCLKTAFTRSGTRAPGGEQEVSWLTTWLTSWLTTWLTNAISRDSVRHFLAGFLAPRFRGDTPRLEFPVPWAMAELDAMHHSESSTARSKIHREPEPSHTSE